MSAMPEGFRLLFGEAARLAENASREKARGTGDEWLLRWQEGEGRRWRSVELVKSMYGWTVRAASGLDGFALLAGPSRRHEHVHNCAPDCASWGTDWFPMSMDEYRARIDGTYDDAARWAARWVDRDKRYRYAYVRVSALEERSQ